MLHSYMLLDYIDVSYCGVVYLPGGLSPINPNWRTSYQMKGWHSWQRGGLGNKNKVPVGFRWDFNGLVVAEFNAMYRDMWTEKTLFTDHTDVKWLVTLSPPPPPPWLTAFMKWHFLELLSRVYVNHKNSKRLGDLGYWFLRCAKQLQCSCAVLATTHVAGESTDTHRASQWVWNQTGRSACMKRHDNDRRIHFWNHATEKKLHLKYSQQVFQSNFTLAPPLM